MPEADSEETGTDSGMELSEVEAVGDEAEARPDVELVPFDKSSAVLLSREVPPERTLLTSSPRFIELDVSELE